MNDLNLKERLAAHKRRLNSGELAGSDNLRKRKRLMMKISKLNKTLASADKSGDGKAALEKEGSTRKKLKKKTIRFNKELKELAQRKQLQRATTLFRKGHTGGKRPATLLDDLGRASTTPHRRPTSARNGSPYSQTRIASPAVVWAIANGRGMGHSEWMGVWAS